MITKPRFVTIDTELFTNGQAAIFDAATNSFTASDGSAVFRVLGNWATATDYVVNDVVLNDGSSYVCILAHTSDATNEPGVGVDTDTYWQVFSQKGDTGATGATGADGADGADGDDGLSAYEIAVLNGFEGDEEAWLASLGGGAGSQADILNSILTDNGEVVTDGGDVVYDAL